MRSSVGWTPASAFAWLYSSRTNENSEGADPHGGRVAQVGDILEMREHGDVVMARRSEIERVIRVDSDRLVRAAGQLGEPRERREPRDLDTGVLESLLADGIGHHDRRFD